MFWYLPFSLVLQSALIAGILWFLRQYIASWITGHINQRFNEKMEEYRLGLRLREQAAEIADYVSLARDLRQNDDRELYRKANAAAFKLFLYLPDVTYKALGPGLTGDPEKLVEALVLTRKALLRDEAGDLGIDDMIVHAPGIGAMRAKALGH